MGFTLALFQKVSYHPDGVRHTRHAGSHEIFKGTQACRDTQACGGT